MTQTQDRTSAARLAARVEALASCEPAWLAALRREAWARWDALPMPERFEHLWRYTDPERIAPAAHEPCEPAATFGDLPADFADGTFENASAYALVRDGVLLRTSVDPLLAGAGLFVSDVRRAAREHADLVQPHLFELTRSARDAGTRFDALSAALFPGGAFVHVPARSELALPVRIASRTGGSGLSTSRSLVVVGSGARATVVFDLTSAADTDATLLHEGVEVFVADGANVRLVFVQELSRRTVHAPVVRARVGRDARLDCVAVALGGALTKSLLATALADRGACANVQGIVFADGRQHFDHHTFQDHVAAHTTSGLDYRTVVGGRARSAYTGRLRITTGGVGADAHQRNHNLLLSETARADTIPELEILTNDVKCSHAAAVGQIDREQVFFCMSRGLTPQEARRTIVLGYLEPAVAAIPGETLERRVRAALERRLEEMA